MVRSRLSHFEDLSKVRGKNSIRGDVNNQPFGEAVLIIRHEAVVEVYRKSAMIDVLSSWLVSKIGRPKLFQRSEEAA